MRRTTIMRTGAALNGIAADSAVYDAVVVGGGLTGCLVAGRLASEGQHVVLVEEGIDIRTKPKWHRQIGCALWAHRYAKRGYETFSQTTPQRYWKTGTDGVGRAGQQQTESSVGSAASPSLSSGGCESGASNNKPAAVSVSIPRPRVLGGSCVMGSRSWILGDTDDWLNTPWSLSKDIISRTQKLESLSSMVPHRGKYGRFGISPRCLALSPLYKPFSEAMNREVPLTATFNRPDLKVLCGCGRPEQFVDPQTRLPHVTLDAYVEQALRLKRPIRVLCDTRATEFLPLESLSLVGDGGGRRVPRKVAGSTKPTGTDDAGGAETMVGALAVKNLLDGSVATLRARSFILAAGAIGSAQLVDASRHRFVEVVSGEKTFESPSVFSATATTFWDCPSVTLQYRTKQRQSHDCFKDIWVQRLALLEWFVSGSAPTALSSSYDDMIAFWASSGKGTDAPDIKFLFQPFMVSPTEERGGGSTSSSSSSSPTTADAEVRHGFQIVVQLMKPKSRGSVRHDAVDPNYFAVEEDRIALQKGVALIRDTVARNAPLCNLIAEQIPMEHFGSQGICGGSLSLGSAVDPESFLLRGTSNVYACDSSIIPQPLLGDRAPVLLAAADTFVDRYLGKNVFHQGKGREAGLNLPTESGEARLVY